MRSAAAAALILLGLSGSGFAREVPVPTGTIVKAPDWVTGSEWYYSDGYALKVTSLSAQGTVFDRIDAPASGFRARASSARIPPAARRPATPSIAPSRMRRASA